jgi:hypothetical protein
VNGTDLPNDRWYKSTYSNGTGECVEVATAGDQVATRDSKNPVGPALVFSGEAWAAFVSGIVAGDFGEA